MSKFRKKPVVIEAWRNPVDWISEREKAELIPDWLVTDKVSAAHDDPNALLIETLEGVMRASPGDWIIQGVQGEIYPCKPDIFEATYEAVDEWNRYGE